MSSSLASFEYLERLPGTTFKRLYQQPSTALAIFRRMLPHLAKTLVMALLYMTKPLLLSDLELWLAPGSKKVRDDALAILLRLNMVTVTAQSPQTVVLTKNFQQSLRLALTGGGDHQSFGVPASADNGDVTIEYLDEYARNQWEGILQYVVSSVGGAQSVAGPTTAVKQLLEAGRMVARGRHSSGITQAGFTFLLQEVNSQVWTLLLLWMENAEQMGMDSVELLAFFFLLGSLELGRGYSTTNLTKAQQPMLANLTDFGLVYIPEESPGIFFPTRLATTLSSDAGALRSISAGFDAASNDASGKGFIVIETNYRLYAYTNSPLQIAVLSLFTKLNTRYPNMVTGRITRDSMYNAISHGITSDQVISFLSTHAHPQLVKRSNETGGGMILPPTVVDQIRLWQLEKERMKVTAGFVFKDFETSKEYLECVKYADENGVLLWRNDKTKMFFVTRVDQLTLFIKSRKAKKTG